MNLPPMPPAANTVPTLRIQLWMETEAGLYFGMGRAQLLEKIEIHG